MLVGLRLCSILGCHPGGVSDKVRWGGEGRHMNRQVALWERWAETAGWLGLRVRHSAGATAGRVGRVTKLRVRVPPVPRACCTPGGEVGNV